MFELLAIEREVAVPLRYKDRLLETAYRADLIVNRAVLLELKAVESFSPLHSAQLLTYLKFLKIRVGLLVNFNEVTCLLLFSVFSVTTS